MQEVVDSLRIKGNIYKKMQEITPKELGIRNKIHIYKATDIKGYFWAIFTVKQKSKILSKDVHKFEEILSKLSLYCEHNFKYKVLFIEAPICSKAKKMLKDIGWKVQ